jgi:hypothetical protein
MKTMRTTRKNLVNGSSRTHQRRKPRFVNPDVPLFPEPTNESLIQWPTEKQILGVSRQLAQISRMGIRSEARGDYFHSGELAYQLQEIIRATSALFERGRRIRRSAALAETH